MRFINYLNDARVKQLDTLSPEQKRQRAEAPPRLSHGFVAPQRVMMTAANMGRQSLYQKRGWNEPQLRTISLLGGTPLQNPALIFANTVSLDLLPYGLVEDAFRCMTKLSLGHPLSKDSDWTH
jgi:hypothetical protein